MGCLQLLCLKLVLLLLSRGAFAGRTFVLMTTAGNSLDKTCQTYASQMLAPA